MPSTSTSNVSGCPPAIVVVTVSVSDEFVTVPPTGLTIVGTGTVKHTAEIVTSTVALGAGLTSTVPAHTCVGKSTRATRCVVALDGTRSAVATSIGTVACATHPGPLPATTWPVTLACVPAAIGAFGFGTWTIRLTVPICAETSPFHHEKCVIVARSARPLGDAALATTVPLPSCVHTPVAALSDHSAMVSPTATAAPF